MKRIIYKNTDTITAAAKAQPKKQPVKKTIKRSPQNTSTKLPGKYVFGCSDILDLLSAISELEPYDISMNEVEDGPLELIIGDSLYEVVP